MSSLAFDDDTRALVRRLERSEGERTGNKLVVVRESLARRLGTLPGTVENLSRGRAKGVRGWLRRRIEIAVISELGAEIGRLEAERTVLVASGHHLACEQVSEIETHLAAVRHLLGKA